MAIGKLTKQKCKCKLLMQVMFVAVILWNFHCMDCKLEKSSKEIQRKIFLHNNYLIVKSENGKILYSPRSLSEHDERKGMQNRNPFHNQTESSNGLRAHDTVLKGVENSFPSTEEAVRHRTRFDFLRNNSKDRPRRSERKTAVEENAVWEKSAGNFSKIRIFSRPEHFSLENCVQVSCPRNGSNGPINLSNLTKIKWTTDSPELLPRSKRDVNEIRNATKPLVTETGQPEIVHRHHKEELEQEKSTMKPIFLNRSTKELEEEEIQTLAFQEPNSITKGTRDISTLNGMSDRRVDLTDSYGNIGKGFPSPKLKLQTKNRDQKESYYYPLFPNTNYSDLNYSSIDASTSESGNSPAEGNKENEILSVSEILYDKFPVKVWKSVGLFDDSYIKSGIDPHWISFEPPNPKVHDALAILYAIIMTFGCSGNFLVIYMFARCRSLRTPANYLIANLAISDFFMLAKMPIFIFNSIYRGPALGAIGCQIYGFVGGLTGTASIMTLTAIAMERYYAIVHPLNPFKRTSTRTILIIASIWIYSGVFSMIPLLGLNGYISEGYLTSCSFDYLSTKSGNRIFVFVFFVAAWLFPLSVIVFSYIEIFRIVQEAEKMNLNTTDGSQKSFKYKKNQAKLRTEIKIAIISSGVVALWILSWSPYAIVALLGIFGKKKYITPFVSAVPALFCKTASCIDPFVYSISHPRFQRELKAKFNVCCPSRKNFATTKSAKDNSFVTASCHASPPLSPVSFSDNLCSNTVKCGPVNLKTNCPCIEKARNHKRKTLSLLKAKKLNEECVDRDEIEMRQVGLERLSQDTKTREINVQIPDQEEDHNKTKLEDNNGTMTHMGESSGSFYGQSEQQEIILHVCIHVPSCDEN